MHNNLSEELDKKFESLRASNQSYIRIKRNVPGHESRSFNKDIETEIELELAGNINGMRRKYKKAVNNITSMYTYPRSLHSKRAGAKHMKLDLAKNAMT